MKRSFYLALIIIFTACSPSTAGQTTIDIDATVNAKVSETLAARPAATAYPTNTPWPTYTAVPKPTETKRPSATPRPTETPAPKIGTRKNPYPLGTSASLVQNGEIHFDMSIADVKRGDSALRFVLAANQFNDKPPAGMEYIVVTVVMTYTGEDKGALQMDRRDWVIVTNGQVFTYSAIPSVCCIQGELEDVKVFSGGKARGIMAWPVYTDDPNPLLAVSMNDDGSGGIYFSTAAQE